MNHVRRTLIGSAVFAVLLAAVAIVVIVPAVLFAGVLVVSAYALGAIWDDINNPRFRRNMLGTTRSDEPRYPDDES